MKVWVLNEIYKTDSSGKVEIKCDCVGVFSSKEDALDKYEEVEYNRYADECEDGDNDDALSFDIDDNREMLDEKGENNDYYFLQEVEII